MQPTSEQHDIIHSTGNIKINAVAGSGKTTTVIEYAKNREAKSKILYLAFNRSVRLEATKKFALSGLKILFALLIFILIRSIIFLNDWRKSKPQ
jgi:F-box protein, helicase, 18